MCVVKQMLLWLKTTEADWSLKPALRRIGTRNESQTQSFGLRELEQSAACHQWVPLHKILKARACPSVGRTPILGQGRGDGQ